MATTKNTGKQGEKPNEAIELSREDVLKEAAAFLGDFHAPTGKSQKLTMSVKISQSGFIKIAQLQATMRVHADPYYTEGDVIDTALNLFEKLLIKQGYEIEPVSQKRYNAFKLKSLAIKEAALNRKARELDKTITKVKSLSKKSSTEVKNEIEAIIDAL